jgi:transposase-like protein
MRTEHFERVLSNLDSLTDDQVDALFEALKARRAKVSSYRALDAARGPTACRHCGSLKVVRNGRARGLQRYLCRDCCRTSCAVTSTPLAGMHHKDKLAAHAACMAAQMTVRDTARELGVAVSTAFRWRHMALKAVINQQPVGVVGLVEADETYFLHSMKGSRGISGRKSRSRGGKAKKRGLSKEQVPVLVAIARGRRIVADQVLPAMKGADLVAALKPVLAPDAVVCSDGNAAYFALARELGVSLQMFSAAKHGSAINPAFHVQSVNSYHSRLKGLLNIRFRGVATKYLPSYLAWMRLLTGFEKAPTPEEMIASAMGRQLINN